MQALATQELVILVGTATLAIPMIGITIYHAGVRVRQINKLKKLANEFTSQAEDLKRFATLTAQVNGDSDVELKVTHERELFYTRTYPLIDIESIARQVAVSLSRECKTNAFKSLNIRLAKRGYEYTNDGVTVYMLVQVLERLQDKALREARRYDTLARTPFTTIFLAGIALAVTGVLPTMYELQSQFPVLKEFFNDGKYSDWGIVLHIVHVLAILCLASLLAYMAKEAHENQKSMLAIKLAKHRMKFICTQRGQESDGTRHRLGLTLVGLSNEEQEVEHVAVFQASNLKGCPYTDVVRGMLGVTSSADREERQGL